MKSKKIYPHTKRIQSLNAGAKGAGIRSGVGVYFDYAASTPVDPMAVKAMTPYYSGVFGNPGSLHKFGQEASAVVFKARNKIAKLINCDYREIIFTGSATEANNLAIRGVVKNFYNQQLSLRVPPKQSRGQKEIVASQTPARTTKVFQSGRPRNDSSLIKPRIITSQIEHESILETCRDLESEGVEVIYLPVSKTGIVDLKELKESLNERTVLVSIMYANNEIGSIQPIKEISEIIREFKIIRHCEESATRQSEKTDRLLRLPRNDRFIQNSKSSKFSDFGFSASNFGTAFPLFHCDAVQAFNYLDCDINPVRNSSPHRPLGRVSAGVISNEVKDLGVDLLTLSSQKIYGPKGVGLLYVKRGMWNETSNKSGSFMSHSPYPISPIITGGGQEEGLRSGTENVAGVIGMAEAAQLAFDLRKKESSRLYKFQEYFLNKIKKIYPRVVLNGPAIGVGRLSNNINIYFPGKKDLIFKLDFAGFAVSGGSACSARLAKPSHVLKALGCSDEKASESIRVSFGRQTTKQEINKLLKALKAAL